MRDATAAADETLAGLFAHYLMRNIAAAAFARLFMLVSVVGVVMQNKLAASHLCRPK